MMRRIGNSFVFYVLFVAKNNSVPGQILATETKVGRMEYWNGGRI
jgi:hypothetical protein